MNKYILRPKEDTSTTFSVRVKNDKLAQFDELAHKSNRSRNELVGIAMQYFMENVEVREISDGED